jgi:hypothetical protein
LRSFGGGWEAQRERPVQEPWRKLSALKDEVKRVMVYFSQHLGAENEPPDSREQARMERFRKKLGKIALYEIYADVQEYERVMRKDLALVMREVVATARKKR